MIIDLHTHTRFGSSCSYMYPDEMARQAKRLGLDGVCITEHNHSWSVADLHTLSEECGIMVLGGVEVATDLGEFMVFGVYQTSWSIPTAEELRRLVDEAGGVMIAAHPFRDVTSSYSDSSSEAVIEEFSHRRVFSLVDAVEVFNGRSTRRETNFGYEVLRRVGLKGTGGSDAHAVHAVGECVTVFDNSISNEAELIAELKAGRFKAVHRVMKKEF